MKKILVLHGDENAPNMLSPLLERETFCPIWASDIETGLNGALTQHPELIILELPVAGISGAEFCALIRRSNIQAPIVVITGSNDEVERILLLEMGADDCIAKPFGSRELLARIRAVLRRASQKVPSTIRFGDVEIDSDRRVITRQGKEVKLTPCEYSLLLYFLHNSDRPLTRDVILNSVWGYTSYPNTRTVDAHVVKLRSKFESNPNAPRHFLTIHGVGYRFAM